MFEALMLTSGVLWTSAYLLIIRQGFRDRTYGMPMAALCANLSWEFIFAVIEPHPLPQLAVNYVWLLFDLVIAYQLVRFGPAEWKLHPRAFVMLFVVSLVVAFFGVLLVTYEFDNLSGSYSAFGQNLMMSVLFVEMLRQRNSLRGQSLPIALLKMFGTIFAAAGFYFCVPKTTNSPLLQYLFVATFVFDLFYVVMVARYRSEAALSEVQ